MDGREELTPQTDLKEWSTRKFYAESMTQFPYKDRCRYLTNLKNVISDLETKPIPLKNFRVKISEFILKWHTRLEARAQSVTNFDSFEKSKFSDKTTFTDTNAWMIRDIELKPADTKVREILREIQQILAKDFVPQEHVDFLLSNLLSDTTGSVTKDYSIVLLSTGLTFSEILYIRFSADDSFTTKQSIPAPNNIDLATTLDQVFEKIESFSGWTEDKNDDNQPPPKDSESDSISPEPVRPKKGEAESKDDYRERYNAYKKVHKEWERANELNSSQDEESQGTNPTPKGKGKENQETPPDPAPKPSEHSSEKGNDSDTTTKTRRSKIEVKPLTQEGLTKNMLDTLLKRARPVILDHKSHPSKFAAQSHKQRFGDFSGKPKKINLREKRKDDIVISLFDGRSSVRYILTFGGEDRRPIFNQILSSEWTALS
jgi:hypothetical protein